MQPGDFEHLSPLCDNLKVRRVRYKSFTANFVEYAAYTYELLLDSDVFFVLV
jgi:hypothetical protein